ncbi:MAG: heavy metal translocating P-type ATPase [Nitrosarchaeum sp.]|nr:heavy metal translocating P-type ATPase [Nitrosarchaeum sp.]
MAKDPVCGMVVNEETGISSEIGGRLFYFCSPVCKQTFVQPEKELAKMKKRMYVAASGALILAIIRAALYISVAAGAMVVSWVPFPEIPFLSYGMLLFIIVTPVQFIGGWTFYVGAYHAVKHRTANMDFLIAMATLTAYIYSTIVLFFPELIPGEEKYVYFEVSAVIIAFVLLGKYMEEAIKKKSSAAVKKLLDLKPAMARVIRDGLELDIPSNQVVQGDIMIIKPGEKIPTDGVVIEGESSVDEKMITGESLPVGKKPDEEVIGATLNKQGLLKVKATKVGKETALSQIIHVVEQAQSSTAKSQRLADSIAAKFVPSVVSASVITFLVWYFGMNDFISGLLAFVAVLIIACPCALGVATPAALMVGVGKGAESGILIRGAEYLERSQKITTIVFDKTGTLTKGEPEVTDIVSLGNISENDLIILCAAVESGSEHPIAQAIVKKCKAENISLPTITNFESLNGLGVQAVVNGKNIYNGNRKMMTKYGISSDDVEQKMSGLESQGKTAIIVAVDKKIEGIIAVADSLKESSPMAIAALKDLGIECIMITGDNEKTANAIAKEVGIFKVIANVLPSDKAEEIKKLQSQGKIVSMVGDGINDAPALAQADIGIAIGSGSDIAKETGGIVLIKDDIMDVSRAIRLSQATMKKIKQNLFWAFAYNSGAIPLAAIGLLSPIIAAAAMALSSISVIANSAMLRRYNITSGEEKLMKIYKSKKQKLEVLN